MKEKSLREVLNELGPEFEKGLIADLEAFAKPTWKQRWQRLTLATRERVLFWLKRWRHRRFVRALTKILNR